MEDKIYATATLMVDWVGTGSPGIILTALAVIYIVGIKWVPPRFYGVGGFDAVAQEDIKDERIGVENSDGGQHVESLGEIT